MAITEQSTGTQTAVIGTEHTLVDIAVAGAFQLYVDFNAHAAGDRTELRVYKIVITGGTRRVIYFDAFDGAINADVLIKASLIVSNAITDAGSVRFTLKQTAGTGRAFPWSVLKLA